MIGTPYLSASSISFFRRSRLRVTPLRILKIGQNVHELRSDAECGFEFVHDHAVLISADRDVLCTIRIPGLQGP